MYFHFHCVCIYLCLYREALLSVAQTFFENEDLGDERIKVLIPWLSKLTNQIVQ